MVCADFICTCHFFGFLSFYCGNLVPKVLFGKQVFLSFSLVYTQEPVFIFYFVLKSILVKFARNIFPAVLAHFFELLMGKLLLYEIQGKRESKCKISNQSVHSNEQIHCCSTTKARE